MTFWLFEVETHARPADPGWSISRRDAIGWKRNRESGVQRGGAGIEEEVDGPMVGRNPGRRNRKVEVGEARRNARATEREKEREREGYGHLGPFQGMNKTT